MADDRLIACACFLLSACGAATPRPSIEAQVRSWPPTERIVDARTGQEIGFEWPPTERIVDARTGQEIGFEGLIGALLEARVVYVGEHHDEPTHHAVQLAVLKGLHRQDPSLALGLEMFQRPSQSALDRFVSRHIDEQTMLAETEYATRWGFDFALYRPLLAYAREHGLPVVALNAPTETTRTVGRRGLDALSEAQRAALPELDLTHEAHRQMVFDALREHPGLDDDALERFYTAQVIWDETMGAAVAGTLSAEGAPNRMVVLAGDMHVAHGYGIPGRAARRGAAPHRVLLVMSTCEVDDSLSQNPRADYLWILSVASCED